MAFLAAVTPFLGTIGAVASGVGTLESGLYNGQVARNNAQIAGQNANYVEDAGFQQAENESLKSAATGGRIKAAQAANGIDVNTGSAVDVQAGQRGAGALDAETVLNNADLSAYGYRTQETNFEAQSQQDTTGGIYGAVGSFAEKASGINLSNWGGGASGDPTSYGIGAAPY